MKDYALYEDMNMPDVNFPIKVNCNHFHGERVTFPNHWHAQIELLYFVKGKAVIECNGVAVPVKPKDLLIINSNDMHSGRNLSGELMYYCIIIDTSLLHSGFPDRCEAKYITPISQNLILFKNKVSPDKEVIDCITQIIKEDEEKETGYELAIKSSIYRLLVLLLRKHVDKILTKKEYDIRIKNLSRFHEILRYIEDHFTDPISVEEVAAIANISSFHFCRLFKEVTGRTLSDYVNQIRITRAEQLLRASDMNITEIALSSGFNDINYFSRIFKRYKKASPSVYRKMLLTD